MRQALFLVVLLLASCQSGGGGPAPTGAVLPTVAGRPPVSYPSGAEARRAFTRSAGSLTATLEDSAWLRFEGDAATVAQKHRAYFDYGYTTFKVVLSHNEFVQPTSECFVLQDSAGARMTGKPVSYDGSQRLDQDGRYTSSFSLSFPHMLTRDLKWIRLSWPAAQNGSSVEWTFEPPAPPCD
jgi:hypothetical protein